MRIIIRHVVLAALPLVLGAAAGYGVAMKAASCTSLVGPLFAAKCHGRQLQYQLLLQVGGTGVGSLLAAVVGAALEFRRRRSGPPPAVL